MKRVLERVLAAMLCMVPPLAGASGDHGPSYTQFRAWTAPDIALPRFQAGELGIVQPGMRRVYLYTAWRAIALGPRAAQLPGLDGGLARADGSAFGYGWSEPDETAPYPLISRLAAALHLDGDDEQVRTIAACPATATTFAVRTLDLASARPDATPARLDAWVVAQQQVGAACQAAQDARYRFGDGKAVHAGAPPPPLPDGEPAFWRHAREYQRAAWYFHVERHADSAALFDRIGATLGHAMRQLGQYLALRAAIRDAVATAKGAEPARREQLALQLEGRGARIVADTSLAPMHEATRAALRAMRVALTPESRLAALSRHLADPAADPFALDRLGDWGLLADGGQAAALRSRHDFIDWIETVRECAGRKDCAAQAAHALERWRATSGRPWLVAALMLATAMPPELERAAMVVAPGEPAYLTVRYHLARLLRLAGRRAEARAVADGVLRRQLSPGTRNLLREERFATATSVRDAARYLLRTNIDWGERGVVREDAINDDGLRWLNERLAVADLVGLAGDDALPAGLRARIAGAAWIRAGLLGNVQDGKRAAALLAQLAPPMAQAVARYTRAASAAPAGQARHVMLVEAMRFGLGAQLTMTAEPVAAVAPGDVTASGWCSFRPARTAAVAFPWRLPGPPAPGGTPAQRKEAERLAPLKTATGMLGDDIIERAASHPDDPELPWLLHVVVMSTRGGCLDADAKRLSRKAFTVLHRRYPDSEWARRTPYFY
ncbi:hypothetical protein GJV26_24990 [Massilia dura]|uniref:Tetratricopeptide repeat protein n=1 Tax=Pseudoduganella dura TaxID=321982 RepID=A0A6I3XJJ1_9BURK|nr:hypothetical protein [Pseudoduganella dura]MUI15686.1 hypothetical protein [Pseudoduganella dura]GGX81662.1 hypothetical protein GCM10007386_10700 [Pseudoduganella dura]